MDEYIKGDLPFSIYHDNLVIYKYEKKSNKIELYYIADGRGMSIYCLTKEIYDLVPSKIEVVSGAWTEYKEKGRWSPYIRYYGTIICSNVKKFSKNIAETNINEFNIKKKFFSNIKKVNINNLIEQKIDISFECDDLIPQDNYECYSKCLQKSKWFKTRILYDTIHKEIKKEGHKGSNIEFLGL